MIDKYYLDNMNDYISHIWCETDIDGWRETDDGFVTLFCKFWPHD
jgi:hypothetical protein